MAKGRPVMDFSHVKPDRRFLVERLRLVTNNWVVPTIIILFILLKLYFAYIGDYFDLFIDDLPTSGLNYILLIYVLMGVRYGLRNVRNTFGLGYSPEFTLKELFINREAFERYHTKVEKNLFNKELAFAIILAGFAVGGIIINHLFILEAFGKPYRIAEGTIAFVDYVVTSILFPTIFFILIGSIVWVILGVVRSVQSLGHAKGLILDEYVKSLQSLQILTKEERIGSEGSETLSSDYSYELFHRKIRVVGQLCFSVSLLLMGATIIYGIQSAVYFRIYGSDPGKIVLLMFVVFLTFFFFIIPQWSLHYFLKGTKEDILNHFKDSYEATKNEYFTNVATEVESVSKTDLDLMARRIEILKTIVSDTEKLSTWSYGLSQLLRLLGAGILPFLPLIIERTLSAMGL